MLISNTFNITMAVFNVAQQVILRSGGLISALTSINIPELANMESTLEGMDLGQLFELYLQTFLVQITILTLSAVIFVIVYGRMIEIYLMTSLAPIPFATFENRGRSYRKIFSLKTNLHISRRGYLYKLNIKNEIFLMKPVLVLGELQNKRLFVRKMLEEIGEVAR